MHIILKVSALALNVLLGTATYCINHLHTKFFAHTIINNQIKPFSDPSGEMGYSQIHSSIPKKLKNNQQTKQQEKDNSDTKLKK